jgi:hypothetical protein
MHDFVVFTLKKIMFVGASAAAGVVMLGGIASANPGHGTGFPHGDDDHGQVGVVNLNNIDVAHDVNGTVGFCDNDVNVLGVQVPVRNVGNGLGVPLLSPGKTEAEGQNPYNCASGGITSAGSSQDN